MGLENYQYQSEFAKKFIALGREEGRVEALVEAILAVLERRGLGVTDALRERLVAITDADEPHDRLERALSAATAEDVLAK